MARTLTELHDKLSHEMAWRKKEVLTFEMAAKKGEGKAAYFARAGLTLLYAHWEGYIKNAAKMYLQYVQNQSHEYSKLKNCFVVAGLKSHLQTLNESHKYAHNSNTLDFIRDSLSKQTSINVDKSIDTESNLSSTVFENIINAIGLSKEPYDTKFNLIDERLVANRNTIAHGEHLKISRSELSDLTRDILQMMILFETDIINAAAQKLYLRPTT